MALTYGQPGQAPGPQPAQGAAPAAPEPAESEYVRSLPAWARRFLREGAPSGQTVGEREMTFPKSQVALCRLRVEF